ncbi:hypothetical protein D3C85_1394990 [compost metagenome]
MITPSRVSPLAVVKVTGMPARSTPFSSITRPTSLGLVPAAFWSSRAARPINWREAGSQARVQAMLAARGEIDSSMSWP